MCTAKKVVDDTSYSKWTVPERQKYITILTKKNIPTFLPHSKEGATVRATHDDTCHHPRRTAFARNSLQRNEWLVYRHMAIDLNINRLHIAVQLVWVPFEWNSRLYAQNTTICDTPIAISTNIRSA